MTTFGITFTNIGSMFVHTMLDCETDHPNPPNSNHKTDPYYSIRQWKPKKQLVNGPPL